MATPFVRPYDTSRDFESCLNIFYKTIHLGVDFEPARTIGSYIWCRSYLFISPSTCFVLDDGNGSAVGYIIGTVSTDEFSNKWEKNFIPVVNPEHVPRPDPDHRNANESPVVRDLKIGLYSANCSMLQGHDSLLERFPAHLHIDILPEFQSKGHGPQLMDAFLTKMKELGAGGVHLGMVKSNDGAKRFYERLGFLVCEEVGEDGDALCLVKEL